MGESTTNRGDKWRSVAMVFILLAALFAGYGVMATVKWQDARAQVKEEKQKFTDHLKMMKQMQEQAAKDEAANNDMGDMVMGEDDPEADMPGMDMPATEE